MNKQQIGRAGELLVQYKLLLAGIESSQLTPMLAQTLRRAFNQQKTYSTSDQETE